jgi:hypothetical protein
MVNPKNHHQSNHLHQLRAICETDEMKVNVYETEGGEQQLINVTTRRKSLSTIPFSNSTNNTSTTVSTTPLDIKNVNYEMKRKMSVVRELQSALSELPTNHTSQSKIIPCQDISDGDTTDFSSNSSSDE